MSPRKPLASKGGQPAEEEAAEGPRRVPWDLAAKGPKPLAWAYLLWHSLVTVLLVVGLVLATMALFGDPHGLLRPITVAWGTVPAGAALGFLWLLWAIQGVAGYLLSIPTLRLGSWRETDHHLITLASAMMAFSVAMVVWNMLQRDVIFTVAYAVSALLTVGLRSSLVVIEDSSPFHRGRRVIEDFGMPILRAMESTPELDPFQSLLHSVSGYGLLMVVWGALQGTMTLCYLSDIGKEPAPPVTLGQWTGTSLTTGVLLMVGAVAFIVGGLKAMAAVKDENRELAFEKAMVSVVTISAVEFAVAVLSLTGGGFQGAAQGLYGVIDLSLALAGYAKSRRLSQATVETED